MSTIDEALRTTTAHLAAAGIEDAALDARYLVAALVGCEPKSIMVHAAKRLTTAQAKVLDGFIARRIAREPVSRILQQRGFWTLELKVTPATLDPRPDTETIVEAALALLREADANAPLIADGPLIADLGTGTGAILLALLSERPDACGLGLDISDAALAVARENAQTLGLAHRCSFVRADWSACLAPRFDLVVSNPPYIPSRDIIDLAPEVRCHDPLLALDGGRDGLDAYRRIIRLARHNLKPSGALVLEAGIGQATDILALLDTAGFDQLGTAKDLGGIERAVFGRLR